MSRAMCGGVMSETEFFKDIVHIFTAAMGNQTASSKRESRNSPLQEINPPSLSSMDQTWWCRNFHRKLSKLKKIHWNGDGAMSMAWKEYEDYCPKCQPQD